MKSVLISIQPKWCELIASGKKTVEVRKTRPKIETPFKCYIYCTANKQGTKDLLEIHGTDGKIRKANGKVIGEFVCDRITEYECSSDGFGELATTCGTCLTYDEIINYCNGNDLYGWHISDLVIYDEPRRLSEFERACPDNVYSCDMCRHSGYTGTECTPITRPPQTWCYVEGE
jgi:predicted transcriptional regulator